MFRVEKKLGFLLQLSSGLLAIAALTNCTKSRPQQWPDGVADDIFDKSYLSRQSATVTLSQQVAPQSDLISIQDLADISDLSIEKADAEERILPMFKDLHLFGRPGASYLVRLEVGAKKVTGFKILSADQLAEMPVMEQQIAKKNGDEVRVPIFEYEIEAQGTVDPVKNDLGEATRTLKLTPTNSDKSTHVQLTTLVGHRLAVGIQESARDSAKEIFLKSQLEGALFSREELQKKLQISVSDSGLYLVKLDGEQLNLFKVQKLSELSGDLRQLILDQDGGTSLATQDVRRCTDIEKGLVSEPLKADCVMVLSYQINQITYVNASRKVIDREGTLSNSVDFDPAGQPSAASFVRIAKDPAVKSVSKDEQVARLDPRSTLVLSEIQGQEFLLRRTMKDSPNTFSYTFAGASGGLEIVKFVPEDKQLRVLRADALLKTDGSTNVDQETLMLLPARYFKVINVDEKGNLLGQPRTVSAHWSEPGAIASIDWSANSIPTINSPLDFYGVEQCFSMLSERKVSEVDHRLNKGGVLNFTLTSTYAGNRGSFDCAGIEDADYFDTVQKTFTFEERVSIKKYVKNGKESPLFNVPYEAQKTLGFGLFTYKKKEPNGNGLTHVDGTEIPLPAIFDISGGKKITYVLAGLPKGADAKSSEIRKRITQATKDVVADLNRAFHQALIGSSMDRSADVITLKIEGVDGDAGQLGDLDRNHIFYVSKTTDSGIIGLGGAHANPRSGEVESASVYLYGGNMLSMVDTLRKLAKAKKEYDQKMAVSIVPIPATAGGSSVESPSERSTETTSVAARPRDAGGRTLESLNRVRSVAKPTFSATLPSAIKTKAQDLARFQPGVYRVTNDDLSRSFARLQGQKLMLANALNDMIGARALVNQEKVRQILFAHQHPGESPRGPSLKAKMRTANICLFDRGEFESLLAAAMSGESDLLDKKSDLEILADIWKGTVAHEIGHNLGLRHNFQGSFDKANWKFSANEKTTRDYSSIMDYLTDDHFTYDGMGPSDVAALRAAYAGLIELHPEVLKLVKKDPATGKSFITSAAGVKTEVIAGNSVRISDYLKSIGVGTWLDLTHEKTAALPLRPRMFCSDEDAGMSPTCNLFDKGSTPEEIVDNIIAGYRERYSLSNFPNDRLVFNDDNLGGYIGRLFSQFTTIRQFLEETFYQAIVVGADGDTVNAHVQAAVKGLLFFNEVIRSPDAPIGVEGDARFVSVKKQIPREDGKGADEVTFAIERKWLKSVASGTDATRLRVRGVELDKTIATIMLTNRDFGFPRYEQASLRLSYPDLEKLLLSDAPSALSYPTISLLNEILHDNVVPQAAISLGTVDAPSSMKAEMSELIRTYANLGAVISLDAVGLTAQDNAANSFKTLSQLGGSLPKNTPYIMQPGSTNDLKYFAYPEALVSRSVIDQGALLAKIRKASPTLQPLMNEWLKLSLGINTAPVTAPVGGAPGQPAQKPQTPEERKAALEAKIDAQLAKFTEDAGPRKMADLGGTIAQVVEVSKQIDELLKTLPKEALYDNIEGLKIQLETMAKNGPTVSLAFGAITGEEVESAMFNELAPSRTAEFNENAVFRNSQLMNELLLMVHPEYRK